MFAPGAFVSTIGPDGRVVLMSGTSAAAPQAAGAVAVAQQIALARLGRMLTPAELRELLMRSGTVIIDGDDERDTVPNTGVAYRRLDLLALAEAVAAFTPTEIATQTPVFVPPDAPGGPLAFVAGTGRTVVVARGQQIDAADLGVYQNGSLAGRVFGDRDRNGTADGGEPGIAGATAFLDANGNGLFDTGETFTTSAPDGAYRFTDVRPGSYGLRVVPTSHWSLGSASVMVEGGGDLSEDIGLFALPAPVPPASGGAGTPAGDRPVVRTYAPDGPLR